MDLNDNVSHYALISRVVQAVESGGNPLDTWSPEWTAGFPVLRIYQPLAHLLVAAIYLLLGKSLSLDDGVCLGAISGAGPVAAFLLCGCPSAGISARAALAAAAVSPLICSSGLFGLEFGSYVWAGNGLFPQSVAAHLFVLSIGLGFRAVRRGKGLIAAGVLLGLTCLAHLIFGYMGAISLILLSLLPDPALPRSVRMGRTVRIGVTAFALSAFQLLPLFLDGAILNHSRWEPAWKWDSFGAATVLQYLLTGKLLDAGRLPVLSLAALAGLVIVIRRWRTASPAGQFAVAGALLWVLISFGRPFWGPALWLIGISPDMQLHRVIAGAQMFLLLLAGLALGELCRTLRERRLTALAAVIVLAALAPPVWERTAYLRDNAAWGRANLAAYEAAAPALNATIDLVKARGGRVYAGVPAGWGGAHKIGRRTVFRFPQRPAGARGRLPVSRHGAHRRNPAPLQ